MNYYHSIRASTTAQNLDMAKMVTMENEKDFDFCPYTRDDLVMRVKQISGIAGFRAIIPFADRNNRFYASTAFACCMSGISIRKHASNCPWKVTYIK
jgi:hypothetical protein